MEPMSVSSPSWDCEDLARNSRNIQKLTSHLHHQRNKIGQGNDHRIGMQPDKRNNQVPPFPMRSKPQDEHDRIWNRKSHDHPLFLARKQRLIDSFSEQ